jgi:DNA repair exonuclease SbcCD ATPase subunit
MPNDNPQDPDPYLELDENAPEDLGEEVQKTNSELEKLRQQLETIEKQKMRLEELKKRQEELETGKAEMLDKLTRSLGTVQRETEEAQKRLEQLHTIQNSFTQHLRYIDSINPKLWGANELPRELSKAISAIEDARADYVKAQAKIAVTATAEAEPAATLYEDYAGPEPRDFGSWFKSGFAFTLPLQIFALLAILTWIWSVLSAAPVR